MSVERTFLVRPALVLGLMCWLALGASFALADRADRGLPQPLPKAVQECAACHVAYPPGLLSASSWSRVMQGLDKHYGVDASLEAADVQAIAHWLQQHAGRGKRVVEQPPEDRITRSPWFERKHRNVAATIWSLPSVKSAANCSACHAGAEKGAYDDDRLRIPPGVTAAQARAWKD